MKHLLIKIPAILLLNMALLGCQSDGMSSKSHDDVVVAMSDEMESMKPAPADGTYTLMSSGTGGMRATQTVTLRKGDMLGFKKMSDGKVMAMAGQKSFDVTASRSAAWQHGMSR